METRLLLQEMAIEISPLLSCVLEFTTFTQAKFLNKDMFFSKLTNFKFIVMLGNYQTNSMAKLTSSVYVSMANGMVKVSHVFGLKI